MKKLDTYLKEASIKQKLMIYLSFGLILFMVLNQVLPPLLDKKDRLQEDVSSLQTNLLRNPARNFKQQLSKNKNLMLEKQELLQAKKEQLSYVMSELYNIDYAFFNETSWTKVIDKIVKQSIKENIKIKSLKNINITDEPNLLIEHKKSLRLEGSGAYSNILAFIQYIENQEILLSYKQIEIANAQEGVSFILNIDLYGVGL